MSFARLRSLLAGCIYSTSHGGSVPPNQPETPVHSVRVPDELWDAALKKAHDEGQTLTDVVIRALKAFLRD